MTTATNAFLAELTADQYYTRQFAGVDEVEIADFAVKHKMNILTFGHSGTGKTSFAEHYARIRGWKYTNIPSNDSLSAPEVQGNMVFDQEINQWVWVNSPFVDVIQNGGVLNIGEIVHASKSVKNFLVSLLDHRRYVTLTAHKGEVINASPDLLIIADFNPNYRGSAPLPEHIADRFPVKLHYDYDRKLEEKYVTSGSLLDLAFGMRSTSVNDSYSSSDRSTVFETPITGRMLKTFELVAKELNFDLACEIFTNNFAPEERSAVKMLLEGASYNIKEDLSISQDAIQSEYETV
jgi:MoxR-like ATPase